MMALTLSACGGDYGDSLAQSSAGSELSTANTDNEQVAVASTNQPSSKGDAPAASESARTNKPEPTPQSSGSETAGSTPTEQSVQTSSNEQAPATKPTTAGTPAAEPAPAPAPVAQAPIDRNTGGTINSLDTIVDDMALLNDLRLVGVNPKYGFAKGPGYNTMGNNPSGANLPSWYLSSYPEMAQTGYWKSIIPWFVLFEGEGNSSSNTRIQMRNMKLFILSRSTNQWSVLVSEQDMGGEFCPHGSNYLHCTGGDNKRNESDGGGISIKPMAGNDFHGWYGGRTAINGGDIKAVFVTLQSRLVLDSSANGDDRDSARYLFDVGADYYPEMGPSKIYLPGVGVSRAKLITKDWRSFSFMTFSDVGNQDPGGGISEAEFRDNPPPLE